MSMIPRGGNPACIDSRKCFAKDHEPSGRCVCRILKSTYKEDGKCPFCKPHGCMYNDNMEVVEER